ncbi:14675_t:CDS:2 [Ambispora leptoticha]|uniref:14675_t:CDS:1 n=1 Tax=Ambispora leptoticha TaxID=144679 RepID=A0A9N8Z921_9GLOM|nr:14675_t:CDS:2 [Ambispora leptoticha]
MNKFQENNSNPQNTNSQNNSQTQNNPPNDQEPSLMSILSSVLTPLVPTLVAKLTGQKLPAITNPVPNDQSSQQLFPVLQSMIDTQNLLLQEIVLLKRNDQNIANSFQSLRLTHEKKQIELGTNQVYKLELNLPLLLPKLEEVFGVDPHSVVLPLLLQLITPAYNFSEQHQNLTGLFLGRDPDYRTLECELRDRYAEEELPDKNYLAEEIAL